MLQSASEVYTGVSESLYRGWPLIPPNVAKARKRIGQKIIDKSIRLFRTSAMLIMEFKHV